jgi:hypothetical protein
MRKILAFWMFFAFFMAGVTTTCGWFGKIDLVETIVLNLSYIGGAFLLMWEMDQCRHME